MGTGTAGWEATLDWRKPRILVIGCGGAGSNSVTRLTRLGVFGATTASVNTDRAALDIALADRKVFLTNPATRGFGAGGRPEIGERSAMLAKDELRNLVNGKDLVVLTVGLGGGTGTGAAPVVAELAQAAGAVVLCVATTPFRVERSRQRLAQAGILRLRDCTDSLIVLDNNRLLKLVPNLPVEQSFAVMDQLISEVIKGVTEAINLPSLISLDFSDVRTILADGGPSTILYGEAAIDDPQRAVDETLSNPLLDVDYTGARGALIHISSGPALSLRSVHTVVEGITSRISPYANVIFGVRLDPRHADLLRVIAILTGVRSPALEVGADIVAAMAPEAATVADVVSHRFR